MQKNKANKWQTSLNQIKKAKLKWRQFSVDKGSVLDHMKSMSFLELQETYNNLPDYFWRDNGEFFANYIFKVKFDVESICFPSGRLSWDLFDKTMFQTVYSVQFDCSITTSLIFRMKANGA
jgi:hypothetical protein